MDTNPSPCEPKSKSGDNNVIKIPNIFITGTPGTGKTLLSTRLATRLAFEHLNISQICKKFTQHHPDPDSITNQKTNGENMDHSNKFPSSIMLEDDIILSKIEKQLRRGGCIVDFHSPDLFLEGDYASYFQMIIILNLSNSLLFDRLKARDYSQAKIQENLSSEMFGICEEQAELTFGELDIPILKFSSTDEEALDIIIDQILEKVSEFDMSKNSREKTTH